LLEIVEKGQPDKYTKTIRIISDDKEIAEGKVYLADEQEAKIFRQKLKRKIKEGDPYSVKVIFKNEEEARRVMEQVRQAVSAKYSQVDSKQVFLLVERNGRLEQVR
jgi:DNA primase large subunit